MSNSFVGAAAANTAITGVKNADASISLTGNDASSVGKAVRGRNVIKLTPQDGLSKLQAAHDKLVSLGGGEIIFDPGFYEWDGVTVNWDSGYVGCDFGEAQIHLPTQSADTKWLNIDNSLPIRPIPSYFSFREFRGGMIYGDVTNSSLESDPGVDAFYFSATSNAHSNRCVVRGVHINAVKGGLTFKDRSYMIRAENCDISGCVYGIRQYAGGTDGTEKNTFSGCNINENICAVNDQGGNLWTFFGGSMDYNNQLMRLAAGGRVSAMNTHFEWSYGGTSGQTLIPIALTGANSSVHIRGGSMVYTGASKDPFYTSIVSADNTSQHIYVQLDRAVALGRQQTTKLKYDDFVSCSANVKPQIELVLPAQGVAVTDVPSGSFRTDVTAGNGIGGYLRYGSENIYGELISRIAVKGNAVVANLAADEGSMTRKNARSVIKITGGGGGTAGVNMVYIAFPIQALRRAAWSFFTNAIGLVGSVTIRERVTGFHTKFDGTTITNTASGIGAQYSPTTLTVSADTVNQWILRDWKDCNTEFPMGLQACMADVVVVEIDLANMTSGALYLSHAAFAQI